MHRSIKRFISCIAVLYMEAGAVFSQEDPDTAKKQIEEVFDSLPSYFQVYPEAALGAGWALMNGTDFNENLVLEPKLRELISLAVAAQIPCQYCIYYHTSAAAAQGASEQEIREAILMASIVRHWSTILHGNAYDLDAFKAETDGFFPGN